MTEQLTALADKIERAEGPSRELDAEIAQALGWSSRWGTVIVQTWRDQHGNTRDLPAYTSSIDAAMTLVPEEWGWDVSTRPDGSGGVAYLHSPDRIQWRDTGGFAATPALALAAAALRAEASK